MEKDKFTPGPWFHREIKGNAMVTSNYGLVADCHKNFRNARLIAAAPEMLAVLKKIVDLDDGDSPDLWRFDAEFEEARAIIANWSVYNNCEGTYDSWCRDSNCTHVYQCQMQAEIDKKIKVLKEKENEDENIPEK